MPIDHNANRVLLGMSGGVDSSVAVQVLKDRGFEVTGLMLMTGTMPPAAIERAKSAADRFNIKLIIKDLSAKFDETVINPFINAYAAGITPNPCVICNPLFKFATLSDEATKLGIAHIATGHYARIEEDGDARYITRAASLKNDQSYFLYRLNEPIRRMLVFPLGSMSKDDVIAEACRLGLGYSSVKSSQDVCFIEGDMRAWLDCKRPGLLVPGMAYDASSGKLLGQHPGSLGFTIGQRKGHGVATGERAYIVRIDHKANSIYLGDRQQCQVDRVVASDVVLGSVGRERLQAGMELLVRTRSSMAPVPARVSLDDDALTAQLGSPTWAPAAGQSLVCYQDGRIACGGIIR